MTLYQIAQSIRANGGTVWMIRNEEYGFTFRADLKQRQIRIVVPVPGRPPAKVPFESGSFTHVVTGMSALNDWLHSICNPTNAHLNHERVSQLLEPTKAFLGRSTISSRL